MAVTERLACATCGVERNRWRLIRFEGRLFCEGGCLDRAIDAAGTPLEVKVNGDVRERIRAWAQAEVTRRPTATLAQLEQEALRHFKHDREFMKALFYAVTPIVAREELRAALGPLRAAGGAVVAPSPALEARAAAFAGKFAHRWGTWTERVGERRVRLLDCTRGQLEQAARHREGLSDEQGRQAVLLRSLATRLEGEQRVRDRFTAREIDQVYAALGADERREGVA